MTMIPLDAIDPAAHADRWRRAFEHHFDLLPSVMDALVTATLPTAGVSRGGSRFDRPKITGNNDEDNMSMFLRLVEASADRPGVVDAGAAADARTLWGYVVEYTRAVTSWLNADVPVPFAPDLPPLSTTQWLRGRPNTDPLLARGEALVLAGWLIDRADRIESFTRLEEYVLFLYGQIRHMRGKYGVHDRPRIARGRCRVCGTLSVAVTWVPAPNGSPKPVRAGKCRECGETYAEAPQVESEAHTAPREVLSPMCADLMHEACTSIHCNCSCHELEGSPS